MNSERVISRKSEMRRSLLSARQAIPDSIWNRCNREINQHLSIWQSDMIQPGDGVMVFCGTRKEPDLQPLVEILWSRGITVGLPVVSQESNEMQFVKWQRSTILRANKWGIFEPDFGSGDLLRHNPRFWYLIPALAVTRDGTRLGYGKGFYDRYLAATQATQSMAVLFQRFLSDEVPTESHDLPVRYICTEDGILPIP